MAADIIWCLINWPKDRPPFLEYLLGSETYRKIIDGK